MKAYLTYLLNIIKEVYQEAQEDSRWFLQSHPHEKVSVLVRPPMHNDPAVDPAKKNHHLYKIANHANHLRK